MSVDSVDVTVSRNNPGCLVRVCFSFSTRGLPALSAPLSRLPAWFLNGPKKSHPAMPSMSAAVVVLHLASPPVSVSTTFTPTQ
uniref:Uncharacterized protein n=1 Tax=Magallana gigas TaxID=29159 RepID=K1PRP5_MAGGI